MDAFRGEYEKLFGMLEKAHGNEIRYMTSDVLFVSIKNMIL